MCRSYLLLAICFAFLSYALPAAAADNEAWRRYDVNGDKRFDTADKKLIFTGGIWAPTLDVNGDGKKDTRDAYALLLLTSTWDRNADLTVSAEDFTPVDPVTLPTPDADAARTLAVACLREMIGKVPADLEAKLRKEWTPLGILTATDEGALWEESGALALTQHNLEVAQWAYAKACTVAPERDSAYANLAFTLAQSARYTDALVLLAYAQTLHPKPGTTCNTIGWIFARTGQLQLAKQYYSEAIRLLPTVAQYQINLGVVLLRLNDQAGAKAAFAKAAALCPNDRDALLLANATNPAKGVDMAACRAEYERERADFNKEAAPDEQQPSWNELGVDAQIDELLSSIAERVAEEKRKALQELEDTTKALLLKAAEPVTPEGKSASADIARWQKNAQKVYDELQRIIDDAQQQANQLATYYERKEGSEILGADQQVLQLALGAAQRAIANYTNGQDARKAFNDTIDDLYTQPMSHAQQQMASACATVTLDLSPVDRDTNFFAIAGFTVIVIAAAGNEAYGKDFEKSTALTEVKVKTAGIDEPGFGLSSGVVGIEWNSETNEVKLQAGQGVIAAGTWSPKSGFGFQLGVGVSVKEGPFKVKAANFLKWGSDGSLSIDYKGGVSVGAGKIAMGWSDGISIPARAATNEPIGALSD